MTIKTAASRLGNGLLDTVCAIHDSNVRAQIDELDSQLETLRKQMTDVQSKKDQLEAQL